MSLELKLAIKVKQRMSYEGRDMKTIEKEILIYQWLSVGEMVKHIEGERAFWVFLLFCSCLVPVFWSPPVSIVSCPLLPMIVDGGYL